MMLQGGVGKWQSGRGLQRERCEAKMLSEGKDSGAHSQL